MSKQEYSKYSRKENEHSFFFEFVMSVKEIQEIAEIEAGEDAENAEIEKHVIVDYYAELLDLFLDSKSNIKNKQLIVRIAEISEILGIPNPYNTYNAQDF